VNGLCSGGETSSERCAGTVVDDADGTIADDADAERLAGTVTDDAGDITGSERCAGTVTDDADNVENENDMFERSSMKEDITNISMKNGSLPCTGGETSFVGLV
jgi:hypothetical protein